jgi:hypothetical protein
VVPIAWSTPQTWTNTTLTTTALNREVRDNLDYLYGGSWTSWTPTLTNITVGDGTRVSVYQQIGKTVRWRFKLTFGSTSSFGAGPTFTLPVTAHANYTVGVTAGNVSGYDASLVQKYAGMAFYDASGRIFAANQASPISAFSSTVPFTWTTSDVFAAEGFYEAA